MKSSKSTKVGSFQKSEHLVSQILPYFIERKDVFEYNVFGSPNQKIGQFANQKKLGDFSC